MKRLFLLNKASIMRGSFITFIVSFLFLFTPVVNVSAGALDIFGSDYGEIYIRGQVAVYTKYVTGIGLAVLVFSIPYLIYLWGTGTPENLKKANQYLISLISGLLVILLGYSIIINFVGKGILGIGS